MYNECNSFFPPEEKMKIENDKNILKLLKSSFEQERKKQFDILGHDLKKSN